MLTEPPPSPTRPRLEPWYRVAVQSDRVVLEHGAAVVLFTGAAASSLLPALLPLLDGSRTIEQLTDVLGVPAAPAIEHALRLLAEHELLTDGPRLEPGRRRDAVESVAALGRLEPDGAILERLSSAHVVVLGEGELTESLVRVLDRTGVHATAGDVATAHGADLVVAVEDALGRPTVASWNREALEHATSWIPIGGYDGRTVTVGPLIVPGETACHECLTIRRESTSGCADELAALRPVPHELAAPLWVGPLVVGLASHRIVRWLAARDPLVPGILTTVGLVPELVVTDHAVLRVPRCPACSRHGRFAAPMPWHEAGTVSP